MFSNANHLCMFTLITTLSGFLISSMSNKRCDFQIFKYNDNLSTKYTTEKKIIKTHMQSFANRQKHEIRPEWKYKRMENAISWYGKIVGKNNFWPILFVVAAIKFIVIIGCLWICRYLTCGPSCGWELQLLAHATLFLQCLKATNILNFYVYFLHKSVNLDRHAALAVNWETYKKVCRKY